MMLGSSNFTALSSVYSLSFIIEYVDDAKIKSEEPKFISELRPPPVRYLFRISVLVRDSPY